MSDPTHPDMFGHFEIPSTKAKQRDFIDHIIKRKRITVRDLQRIVTQFPIMDRETMSMLLKALLREEQGQLQAIIAVRAELHNHGPEERVPPTSDKFDDAKKAEIIRIKQDNPQLAQHVIAAMVNVSPGRVNNTFRGVRE